MTLFKIIGVLNGLEYLWLLRLWRPKILIWVHSLAFNSTLQFIPQGQFVLPKAVNNLYIPQEIRSFITFCLHISNTRIKAWAWFLVFYIWRNKMCLKIYNNIAMGHKWLLLPSLVSTLNPLCDRQKSKGTTKAYGSSVQAA